MKILHTTNDVYFKQAIATKAIQVRHDCQFTCAVDEHLAMGN